jgi:hypothetical protein
MRKEMVLLGMMFAAACASQHNNASAVAEPEIVLEQLSSAPASAEHVTGGIPVQFRLSVTNTAGFPITLKRLDMQSVGAGGYDVSPTSLPFSVVIAPGETVSVDFWVPAYATTSVVGVNGAVAVRLTSQFQSPSGVFRNVSVRQVMGSQQ